MISKKALTAFRKHMVAAAKEAGVKLEMGTITYNDNYFSFTSKAYLGDEGKREEFIKFAPKKNIPLDWFNKQFIGNDGDRYTIVGIKPRGRKNVLSIENCDGKTFVCDKSFVRRFPDINKGPGVWHPSAEKETTTITKNDIGVLKITKDNETLTIAKCETFDPYLEQLSKDLT